MEKKMAIVSRDLGNHGLEGLAHFDEARHDIVLTFATLPDEAFDFLVAQNMQIGHEAGGFRDDSKIGLETLSKASEDYFMKKQTQADRA